MSSVKRVRKLPVEVEAIQFTEDTYVEIRDFVGRAFDGVAAMNGGPSVIRIRTLEGVMAARRGDWIIRGVAGEFYPCKPDVFEKTYEVLT